MSGLNEDVISTSPTVLLTGAAGFAGRHFAAAFASRQPKARRYALVRSSEPHVPGWETIVGDLTDEGWVAEVIAATRPDWIVHLAAQASVATALKGSELTWRDNFTASLNLAAAISRYSPQSTLLFASTAEVYGDSFRRGAADEQTTLSPANPYARSKAAVEAMLGDVLGSEAKLITCRAFNHIGPGQDERFAVASFAGQIARIEKGRQAPEIAVGNLAVKRDFLHVGDVVDAYVSLLESATELSPREVFNVASGTTHPLSKALDIMIKASSAEIKVLVDPARVRASDVPIVVGNANKLRETTGWRPKRSFEESVLEVLDYQRSV